MGSDWDRYIEWAKRIYSVRNFDLLERDYKLSAFARLNRVVNSFIRGRTGPSEIRQAIQGFNNVRWQEVDSFVKWGTENPAAARDALRSLWRPGPVRHRLDVFVSRTPKDLIESPAARINLCSVFLAAQDPRKFVPFRHRPITRSYELTSFPPPHVDASEGERYEHSLVFFDRVLREARQRRLVLRDRLDAQGIMWAMINWGDENFDGWSAAQKRQLGEYRGKHVASRTEPASPSDIAEAQRVEGATRQIMLTIRERDPKVRRDCIAHWGCRCVVCGLDLRAAYGEKGEGFIHVHHLNPLARAKGVRKVVGAKDLRPVCPNCHLMLHAGDGVIRIEALRRRIAKTGWAAAVASFQDEAQKSFESF